MGTRLNSVPLGLRISQDADDLLRKLAKKRGTTKTSVLEVLIKQQAKDEGIDEIEDWRKPISVATVRTPEEFDRWEAALAKLPRVEPLAPGADSKESIYGDRG
jgi:hypothetical protein